MKNIITFLLLLSSVVSVYSQIKYYNTGSYRINFGFNYNTSSSYYDLDGKQVLFSRDTFNIIVEDSIPYTYNLKRSFELREYIVSPGFEYSISDNFISFLNVPLMWTSLIEQYETDTNSLSPTFGQQTTIGDYSAFTPLYYEIGGLYRINKGFLSTSMLMGAQLPPTLKNGYQIDTTNSMYIYNAYKFYAGLISTLNLETGFLEMETSYKLRTGDFNDMFLVRLEGGFTSVPNTALKGIFIYSINIGEFGNAQSVNPRLTTLQESSIDVGASFEALIKDKVKFDFSYLIRLGLTNSINYGQLRLKTSILLD